MSLWSRVPAAQRAALRRACLATHGPVCWLCGQPIDLTLPPRHPRSFSLDHVVPPRLGGSLLDPANHRPAHLGHNAGKRDRDPRTVWRPRLDW